MTATGASIQAIEVMLERDCENVSTWMKCNRLKLNPEKTKILTLGTKQKLKSLKEFEVFMDNKLLKQDESKCEALLGCHIDADLKWHSQVSTLKTKLSKRLSGLLYLRHICSFQVRKTVAEGFFNSVLLYCLPLFGGLENYQIKDIQILQNKAARLVLGVHIRSNRLELFKELGWMSMNQLICYHTLINIFKIRLNKDPEYLAQFLCQDSRNGRIQVPRHNLALTSKSFCYRGADSWNRLPQRLRRSNKLGWFKIEVRKWIAENVPFLPD